LEKPTKSSPVRRSCIHPLKGWMGLRRDSYENPGERGEIRKRAEESSPREREIRKKSRRKQPRGSALGAGEQY